MSKYSDDCMYNVVTQGQSVWLAGQTTFESILHYIIIILKTDHLEFVIDWSLNDLTT